MVISEPRVWCNTCGTIQLCSKHMSAEHPPTAAEKWLRKDCKRRHCSSTGYVYACGIIIGKAVGEA